MKPNVESYDMPVSHCTSCNKKVDCAAGVDDVAPQEGDFSLCLDCGHIMAFNKELILRDLTEEEVVMIAGNEEMLRMQKFIALYKKVKKEKTA